MKRGEFWKSSAVDWVNFDKSNPKRKARKLEFADRKKKNENKK